MTATATKIAPAGLETRMYVDGHWINANDGRTLGVINPATEEVIAEVAFGGRAETRMAVEAAGKAMPGWMKLTAWIAQDPEKDRRPHRQRSKPSRAH